MASWREFIVSGSDAQLATLQLDTALGVLYGGTGLSATSASAFLVGTGTTTFALLGSNGSGQVVRSIGGVGVVMSGSFSGSFIGSGAGLTGVTADSTFTVSGSNGGFSFQTATDSLLFTTASSHGFDLSSSFSGTNKFINLVAPQNLRTNATPSFAGINGGLISGSTLNLSGIQAGLDNSVVVVDSNGFLVTDEIDARVWGSTLVDNAGGNSAATRVAVFSDADSLLGDANFTFQSNVLTVNGSTFGQDVRIAGNLTVLGDTTVLDVTNLLVEDKFILLNSGSANGDGGIIVQSGSAFNGVAFGWDESAARWGIQQNTLLTHSSSAMTPEAYMAVIVDQDGGMTDSITYQKVGNIKISGSKAYLWI